MKDLLKYMLATMLAMLCMGVFACLMGFILLLSVAAAGNQKPQIENGTVLRISLSGAINERAEENPFAKLLGNSTLETQGLDDMLAAIKAAKANKKVKGIYIEGGALTADFATLQELRGALAAFKKSGKFIIAYGDSYTQGAYYVASVADKVLLNPSGLLDWHGLSSQPIFYKDLLDKLGVKIQVFRVGTYKSYVEPYTRTEMSEANRRQVESFIGDIWQTLCKDVAASRKITTDSLNSYADRYMAFAEATDYRKSGLVDSLCYVDGVRDKLRKLAGVEKLHMVGASALAKTLEESSSDNKVAVYYAEGSIVDEATSAALGGEPQIVGKKVVGDLDELMNDEDVKAVVLRINSGGGSAYASEQMWRAIQLLKSKKPVVVSMSGMAASGGYYMSCGADVIFAEPTTLTGSIGIFGMIPDATGLLTDKLGLHFDVAKTNEASDFGAMGRPLNAGESAAVQSYVNRGYALFLKRVAQGRKMKVADVDSIAQGRVWTGAQALKIKLVDRLGNLDDAVAEAARRAKVKDYSVAAYPAAASWMDNLMEEVRGDYMESRLRTMLGEYYRPLMFVSGLQGADRIQARIPFEPNLK